MIVCFFSGIFSPFLARYRGCYHVGSNAAVDRGTFDRRCFVMTAHALSHVTLHPPARWHLVRLVPDADAHSATSYLYAPPRYRIISAYRPRPTIRFVGAWDRSRPRPPLNYLSAVFFVTVYATSPSRFPPTEATLTGALFSTKIPQAPQQLTLHPATFKHMVNSEGDALAQSAGL